MTTSTLLEKLNIELSESAAAAATAAAGFISTGRSADEGGVEVSLVVVGSALRVEFDEELVVLAVTLVVLVVLAASLSELGSWP